MFATIGLIFTLRLSWNALRGTADDSTSCRDPTFGSCPWKHVISDFANRLHLLEFAFKEQVLAREVIEREVTNQSDSNTVVINRLMKIVEDIDRLKMDYRVLRSEIISLQGKVQSDELLGTGVILAVVLELIFLFLPQRLLPVWNFRPRTGAMVVKAMENKEVKGSPTLPAKNGVLSFSPKHGVSLKNEMSIVTFQKCSTDLVQSLVDILLKNIDGSKMAPKPFHVMKHVDDIKCLPRTKLFLVFADSDSKSSTTVVSGSSQAGGKVTPPALTSGTGSGGDGGGGGGGSTLKHIFHGDIDMAVTTIRYVLSLGAQVLVILTNDEGSKRLTANAIYNSTLRPVYSHDALRDLASKGRLFTMYRELTSHQVSHMRKAIITILNLRSSLVLSPDR